MLLSSSSSTAQFSLMGLPQGYSESFTLEPQELGQAKGIEASWQMAQGLVQTGEWEGITIHQILRSGKLAPAEAWVTEME